MESALNYLPLFLIILIAWIVPMVLSWLEVSKVPSVIVEIIMGVIVGPFVLDWIGDESYMRFLAATGFLFLIFLSGLEIDINKIATSFPKGKLRRVDFLSNAFLLASFIYLGSLIISVPVAYVITLFFEVDMVFFILMLPTVSLSIIVPILKGDGEISRKFGQIILMEAAIATIMSIILISLYSGILQNGFRSELLLFLLIFVAFFVAHRIGKWLVKIAIFQKLMYTLEHAASQIRIRGSIAVMLFFVVIAGLINTELILGAFIAGALLSIFLPKERSAVLFKLDGMSYGFFIPIFFIMVGVNLDLSVLGDFSNSIPFVLTILISFFVIQTIPIAFVVALLGWKKSFSAGMLLSSRLGLSIATAQIGLALGVISPATNTAIVIACIISSLLAPLSYKYFNTDGKRVYSIFLIGRSEVIALLAERMRMHGIAYLVIEKNKERADQMTAKGLNVHFTNIIDQQLYTTLDIRSYNPVVIIGTSDEENSSLLTTFKNSLNHEKIIAIANNKLVPIDDSGNIQYVKLEETLASQVENLLIRPSAYGNLGENFETFTVEEITMTNHAIDRKKLKHLALHPSGSLILIRRQKEVFIPHGDTHLLLGDMISIIGNSEALQDFREKFS